MQSKNVWNLNSPWSESEFDLRNSRNFLMIRTNIGLILYLSFGDFLWLGKGKICLCIFFRLQTFAHINIPFAIQKILRKMSVTRLSIFLHILPKFRDFSKKLLFLGIFVNISSILPQICPFLTGLGNIFRQIKFSPKFETSQNSQKNLNFENLGKKFCF